MQQTTCQAYRDRFLESLRAELKHRFAGSTIRTQVLALSGALFRPVEVVLKDGKATVMSHGLVLDCVDLSSALDEVAAKYGAYSACIDAVHVHFKTEQGECFLRQDHEIALLAQSLWASTFEQQTVCLPEVLDLNATLDAVSAKIDEVERAEISFWINTYDSVKEVEFYCSKHNPFVRLFIRDHVGTSGGVKMVAANISEAFAQMRHCVGAAHVFLDTVVVRTNEDKRRAFLRVWIPTMNFTSPFGKLCKGLCLVSS